MARGKAAGKDRHGPARRPPEPEADNSSAWLTTYGDAVTLLLAFFVMLFAMSSTDAAKFEEMARSMRAAFVGSDSILPDQSSVVAEEQASTPPSAPAVAAPAPDLSAQVAEDIDTALREAGLDDLAEVVTAPEAVSVRVRTDEVLFATGSAEVRPVAREILAALGPSIRALDHPVRIEGHTDDVPIHRSDYSNWNLSADRAVAVVHLLLAEHDVAATRLSAIGFGEHAPLVPNDSPEHRSENRRVEIVIATAPDADAVPEGVAAP